MTYSEAFDKQAPTLSKYEDNAFLIWATGLYLDEPNLDDLANEALTDGPNDKKIDLIKLDTEQRKIILAQGYYSSRKIDSAPENKASDLLIAATWLLTGELAQIPPKLKNIIRECRDALKSQEIDQIDLLYIHNLPESKNIRKTLEVIQNDVNARIATPEKDIVVIAKELGSNSIEELFISRHSAIAVKGEIVCPAKIYFREVGPNWEAAIVSLPGSWLHELYQSKGDSLYSANYRGFLGASKKKKINSNILNTAEKEPENFWAYNNGITILTLAYEEGVDESNNPVTKLDGISIINGAQTSGSIGNLDNKKHNLEKIRVLGRIIKCNDLEITGSIIRYNNTQNQITSWDRYSNDTTQKNIANEFRLFGFDYSLKRGFESSDSGLSIQSVAQAILAFRGNHLDANAGKNKIFDNEQLYKSVFDQTKARHILLAFSMNQAINQVRSNLRSIPSSKLLPIQEKQSSLFSYLKFKFFLLAVIGNSMPTLTGKRTEKNEVAICPAFARDNTIELIIKEMIPAVSLVLAHLTTYFDGKDVYNELNSSKTAAVASAQVAAIIQSIIDVGSIDSPPLAKAVCQS
ncbi:MAG: AIPR family protein [Bacteroidia bacterium]|nr:AIPR family protein [Bacteroidia bacterium]